MNLFIQESAEQDILRQAAWYAEKGVPQIGRRFHSAVLEAIDAVLSMPEAGPPKATGNPRLAGLRSWHVKGLDELRVYYLVRPGLLTSSACCTANRTSPVSLGHRRWRNTENRRVIWADPCSADDAAEAKARPIILSAGAAGVAPAAKCGDDEGDQDFDQGEADTAAVGVWI